MPEEKRRRFDLLALGLLTANAFLAVSLLTYDPADPPSSLIYPPRTLVQNACGPLGAFAARTLFDALGIGAYFVSLTLAVVTLRLLMGRTISDPALRFAGWLLTAAGLCTTAAFAAPYLSPGPVIGPGGYLGAAGRGLLETHFATAGSFILIVSVLIGGVTLCMEELVMRSARICLKLIRKTSLRLLSASPKQEPSVKNDKEQPVKRPIGKARSGKVSAPQGNQNDDLSAKSSSEKCRRETESVEEDRSPQVSSPLSSPPAQEENKPSVSQRIASAFRITNRHTKQNQRNAVQAELEAASRGDDSIEYELPPLDLLMDTETFAFERQEDEVRGKAELLERTFTNFGFNIKVVEIETGPVIAQYEIELEAGLRLNKITGLSDDLAVALRVPSVRIVAPLPGKNTVGIEIPNADRQLVRLREVMEEGDNAAGGMHIPIYLGKDVSGNPMVVDLATLPHLLIAGRTGTGKSVCLNTMIMSMLMTRRPDEVKMLLIDPKMVELTPYSRLPHLMHPVVTDMKKAEAILAWAVDKMEERYSLLMRAGVRHMSVYNQLGDEELRDRLNPETDEDWEQIPKHLPYIVIVADELADLMMTAPKEVESHIIRLAQKSRAVGIHLVLATQKPTVDVITGLIKSNLPARISFQVASRVDSRVVLDEMGAEKLLGNGDLLFLWPGTSTMMRGQGAFVSDDEIRGVVDFLSTGEPQYVTELVKLKPKDTGGSARGRGKPGDRDELFESAVEVVVREGRGSVSLLQRSLGIGYGRAARLIDHMAEDGVVGPYNGSQAREVLLSSADWADMQGEEIEEPQQARSTRAVAEPQDSSDENLWEDDEEDEFVDSAQAFHVIGDEEE